MPLPGIQSSMVHYRLLSSFILGANDIMRLQIFQRGWFTILFLAGTLSIITAMTLIEASSASAATAAKKSKQAVTAAEATAQRYAEAMGKGDKVRRRSARLRLSVSPGSCSPPWHQDLSGRLRPRL